MQKVSNHDAKNEFLFVMDQVCSGLGHVLITGMRGNAVLVSEDEWRAMQILIGQRSMPDIRESAVDELAEPSAGRAGENTV